MHKIVHLDLKGAPLKLPFLETVLNTIKQWGATGILLEWEDSFPYTGEIAKLGSLTNASGDAMYSAEEVRRIFQCARENGLEVIQLVQTIGHLEFVLKHPSFRMYQEKYRSPAVLCPSQKEGVALVRMMLQQALDAQPDAKYFHIGADEVWHRAVCLKCQLRAKASVHGKACLYLEHIRHLALFIKEQRPDLTILIWDDMLRSTSTEVLKYYNLGELVQPVVWDYSVKQDFQKRPQLWDAYKMVFSNVWVGSAFKGANGSCQIYPVTERYMSNQQAWIDEVQATKSVRFSGVILTGWSRYDHFATLCELLAVSLECLYHCLNMWNKHLDPGFTAPELAVELLPAPELYQNMKMFNICRQRCNQLLQSDVMTTWMNPWQLEHGYTNPTHVEIILHEAIL